MNNPIVTTTDKTLYSLRDVAIPTGSIPATSIGKSVQATGHYIANFKAPNQIDGNGKVADWEVALLQNETDTAILVVRGLWKDRFVSPDIVMATQVEVTGTLLPHQNDDRAANTSSQLSRLDSSLIVATTDMQLYDGFILGKSEKSRAGAVERTRILEPELSQGVPGYYWQHISYVVIWWFMVGVVIWMPFYKRREEKL